MAHTLFVTVVVLVIDGAAGLAVIGVYRAGDRSAVARAVAAARRRVRRSSSSSAAHHRG